MRVQVSGVRCLWGSPSRFTQASRCARNSVFLRPAGAVRTSFTNLGQPQATPNEVTIRGKTAIKDPEWFNVPHNVLQATKAKLHVTNDHPISITRQIIQNNFPAPTFKYYNDFSPVVSVAQNFDSLGFPPDHPGRSRSDTYYINQNTLLRTHTSAHQAETFRANKSDGYLIAADVYRRDAIDRSHYPIFHQMEGARTWDRNQVPNGDVAAAVWRDVENLPQHDIQVDDPNPVWDPETNPLQELHHSPEEVEAIAAHLKQSLEAMVVDIFTRAQRARATLRAKVEVDDTFLKEEPLQMRWVEAYFPFTSPSWELEVFYDGNWFEVLGCGVVKQDLLINADAPSRLGWAFGIGIDRIAMLLCDIIDIRTFWSRDKRFSQQFKGVSNNLNALKQYVPFSRFPACPKDVAFWTESCRPGASDRQEPFHENDVMEIVREVAGDMVEDVTLRDRYEKYGRTSLAYRITYRSLERTLTNREANEMQDKVREALVERLGVEIR
ncbi:hypothetical protein B0T10DRAFT_86681 [Thelonectria olida]|uniref:Phenylalanine--tRNA ligase, mitochondrial n=1 Tax=Thelonectria olida TaxID=1576542 RepID=A0A9P8VZC5_9HYPO|nr:hypothetical protein B0T10DRAFT_86681 [Thelonectria olida]